MKRLFLALLLAGATHLHVQSGDLSHPQSTHPSYPHSSKPARTQAPFRAEAQEWKIAHEQGFVHPQRYLGHDIGRFVRTWKVPGTILLPDVDWKGTVEEYSDIEPEIKVLYRAFTGREMPQEIEFEIMDEDRAKEVLADVKDKTGLGKTVEQMDQKKGWSANVYLTSGTRLGVVATAMHEVLGHLTSGVYDPFLNEAAAYPGADATSVVVMRQFPHLLPQNPATYLINTETYYFYSRLYRMVSVPLRKEQGALLSLDESLAVIVQTRNLLNTTPRDKVYEMLKNFERLNHPQLLECPCWDWVRR